MCSSIRALTHSYTPTPMHTVWSASTCYVLNYGIYKLHLDLHIYVWDSYSFCSSKSFQHFIQLTELDTIFGRGRHSVNLLIFRVFFDFVCFYSFHFVLWCCWNYSKTPLLTVVSSWARAHAHIAHTRARALSIETALKTQCNRYHQIQARNLQHIKAFVGQITVCACGVAGF